MAEKKVIELEIKTESVGSLKQQLREAQAAVAELSEKFGATSKEAINAAKRAAELKDAIGDAKALTDAFNPDAKFNALSASIGGLLNGFQAFEGAMALVGVESEELQETLLKVQAAMALSQGLQGLLEARDSFKQLGAVAMDALKGIRTGIAATGIGLLVVAIGTLVAYWDDIKSAISGVSAEQEALNIKSQKDVDLQKEKLESLDSQDNILKLQGLTEKQILQLKIKQTDEAIKAYEISIKNQEQTLKAQIEAEKRNKKILKGILEFILAPINLLLKTVDEIGSFLGKDWDLQDQVMDWTASLIFDPKEVEQEGMKAIQESKKALAELKNQQAGFQLEIQNIEKEAAQKRKDAAKEAAEKRREAAKEAKEKALQDEKDNNEKIKKAAKDLSDELNDIADKALQKQKEDQQKRKEEAEKAEKAIYDNAKGYAEAKVVEDQNNLQAKIDLLAIEKSIVLQNKELTEGEIAAIEAKYRKERDSLEEQAAEKQKQINQQRIDLVLKYAQTFGNAMGSLTNLLNVQDNERLKNVKKGSKEEEAIKKKMFERDKKLRIVQTIIDTASNIIQSVRNGGGIPTGIPFGVAAGVMGALQIAAIKKTSFDAGGGEQPSASGGAGSSGAVAANVITPNFNVVGNAQATNPLAGLGNQPLQAYVVSGEVTTAQSLDRNRINYATFG